MRVPKIGRRATSGRPPRRSRRRSSSPACEQRQRAELAATPRVPTAEKIDNLFIPILIIAIVDRHRGRRRHGLLRRSSSGTAPGETDNPKQIHGNTPLEIGWTIVPALILAVIAVPTIATIFDLAEEPDGPRRAQGHASSASSGGGSSSIPKQPMDAKAVVTANELAHPGRPPRCYADARPSMQRHPLASGSPSSPGKKDVVPGRDEHAHDRGRRTRARTSAQCAEYCGLVARQHALPGDRAAAGRLRRRGWPAQQRGPGAAAGARRRSGELTSARKFQCTNCHVFDDSSTKPNYGPNLTHLASRTTFAGGVYELNRENLIDWVLDAPSMIPMQSKDCRLPPPADLRRHAVVHRRTRRKGQPVMTQRAKRRRSPTTCWSRSSDAGSSPMTAVPEVLAPPSTRRDRCCAARRRRPASGAGSPPSTTRRSRILYGGDRARLLRASAASRRC